MSTKSPNKKETPRRGRPPGWRGRADATYWTRPGNGARWKCAECRAEFREDPTGQDALLMVRTGHSSTCSQYPAAEVAALQEKEMRAHRMTNSLADFLRPAGLDASNATGSWGSPPDPAAALRIARETHATLGKWLEAWDVEPVKEEPAP